jgi:flagella basal body P-ring formation protein FlgA
MMLLALLAAACFPVSGPNITARDLAKAVPAFAPAEPDATIAYTPWPGVQRVMYPGEARQILARLGYDGAAPTGDICFERPVAPVPPDAALKAMHQTLGPDAHIEIVELSRFPAPAGDIVFPREDIGTPPAALWRGYVLYDSGKKFPIWARVQISVRTYRLIALEELKPGIPIKPTQVAIETVEGFPEKRMAPASVEQAEGALPRRFISAKSPVWMDAIDPPNDVMKGDRVSVIVRSGLAQLAFDAEAESSGRRGDFVSFKNPESGKLFRARIEGPGKAWVETPSIRQQ